MNKAQRQGWVFVAALSIVVLATAIYAVTTWNTASLNSYSSKGSGHLESQLPNQDNMGPSLQAQPDNSGGLNAGSSSAQLQQTSVSPNDNPATAYPGCRGNQLDSVSPDVMCQAP